MKLTLPVLLFAATLLTTAAASADREFILTIENHQFIPAEIQVPAGQRIVITVVNKDPSSEEFESHELKVEKIIPPNGKVIVRVGPLKPGRYPFVGEFHADTAQGTLVAKD